MMTHFNKTIHIYRSDVENMQREIGQMIEKLDKIYYWGVTRKQKYMRTGTNARMLRIELYQLEQLYDKTDDLLADEFLDFICVDADEWFDFWQFEENVDGMFVNKYYMFPDSDEVDEIFEKMKSEYKYTVVDLFGIYRFCPIDKDIVVA